LIFFSATRLGIEAVEVFFVLSGFLVGGKVLERVRKGTFDYRDYAFDRISRIYVPLVPALLFTAFISLICGNSISVLEFLGNLFCLQGLFCDPFADNGPLWSLAYEFWFYLLAGFAPLVLSTSYRRKVVAIFAVMVVSLVFTRLDASMFFCWCLGSLSYSLLESKLSWKWFLVGLTLTLFGCALSQLLSGSLSVDTKIIGPARPSRTVGLLIFSLGLTILLPSLAQKQPGSRKWLSFERAGTHLAAFSYTLYLIHAPLLKLWDAFLLEKFVIFSVQSVLWFIAKLSSCLLVAWLFYLPFEAQTGRVRNWMKQQWMVPKP